MLLDSTMLKRHCNARMQRTRSKPSGLPSWSNVWTLHPLSPLLLLHLSHFTIFELLRPSLRSGPLSTTFRLSESGSWSNAWTVSTKFLPLRLRSKLRSRRCLAMA
jgi:hypothetical protein